MNDLSDEPTDPQILSPDDRTVTYVFPVEVVVVGALTDDDHKEIYQTVWNDFGRTLSEQFV
ncbi:hypothetical protein [Bradyrhizobium sp.]|uniref:hypothetical protein n=1 Tax=Bradyrhizobium sp. TaxID=376 RepID=UPI001D96B614|nr:hypothetical protein [Bradyrhizobium sp.]MBV8700531.1 hypothetical protein [Bradyrhizobium sp.]MBV8921114.1 hypothetical protein [Bradyrhizobium sp.]MBV9981135.1 hypothetical protein [Bradyrhizobium sp.]